MVAVGVYDALTAILAQRAGFEAVFVSGLAVAATQLAAPDIGLLTREDVLLQARRVTRAVDCPVICDIDTGFGDVLHLAETIRQAQQAGVSAVQLEDQLEPKRCPVYEDPVVLDRESAVHRVAAAVEAVLGHDFTVIARTDAFVVSFEEAVIRANMFLAAGAGLVATPLLALDGVPLSSLEPREQLAWHTRFAREVDGRTMALVMPSGACADDMFEAGYDMVVLPTLAMRAAVGAVADAFARTRIDRSSAGWFTDHPPAPELTDKGLAETLGLHDLMALRRGPPAPDSPAEPLLGRDQDPLQQQTRSTSTKE